MSLLPLVVLLSALAADEVVALRAGASLPIAGTSVTITFVRVASDSRCPKGVTCIWEGDAVVELRVQRGSGEPRHVELHANPRFDRQATVEGVTLTLEALEPEPEADKPVAAAAYVASIRIRAD